MGAGGHVLTIVIPALDEQEAIASTVRTQLRGTIRCAFSASSPTRSESAVPRISWRMALRRAASYAGSASRA